MSKEPEKKNSKAPWFICLIIVLALVVARLICHFAGVEFSDNATRIFGSAEFIATMGMVFFYMRWRKNRDE